MKFKVLVGTHVDEQGRQYNANDIVESKHDLSKTFVNKFLRLDGTDPHLAAHEERVRLEAGKAVPTPEEAANQTHPRAVNDPGDGGGLGGKKGADTDHPPSGAAGDGAAKPKGSDVTKQFPTAGEQDYVVYKDGGEFYVYDADDTSKSVNAKGVSKDEVEGVINRDLKSTKKK